mgnify:CR=1 FL=1
MEGVRGGGGEEFIGRKHREAVIAAEREVSEEELLAQAAARPTPARSPKVRTDLAIPTPPFWGWRVVDPVPAAEMFAVLDLNSMFRLSWGATSLQVERWDALLRDDFLPRLERLKQALLESRAFRPVPCSGYCPCQSAGHPCLL